jgi:hypothetical protein
MRTVLLFFFGLSGKTGKCIAYVSVVQAIFYDHFSGRGLLDPYDLDSNFVICMYEQ